MNNDHKALFEALQQGDLGAFEQILFLYEKAIFNYVLRLVRDWHEAQDITQEAFVKIYQHRKDIDTQRSARAWMYKIANNTAYDYLRKRQQRRELFIIDDPNNPFETIDPRPAYHEVEAKETKREIERALTALKPVHKSVLILFYIQELRYEEISVVLDIPLNTVKTYLHRAKAALKKELTQKK